MVDERPHQISCIDVHRGLIDKPTHKLDGPKSRGAVKDGLVEEIRGLNVGLALAHQVLDVVQATVLDGQVQNGVAGLGKARESLNSALQLAAPTRITA